MTIAAEFREFAACLNRHDVRYLVAGGHAVAFHGHPRYTKDFDIWIDATPDNAERLLRALAEFGFGEAGLQVTDFVKEGMVIQLGYPPHRIDLLTSLTGVSFDACYEDRETVDADGVVLRVIGLEGLRQNKRALGRHQDLADLENLD
jgi:hypothetical protein